MKQSKDVRPVNLEDLPKIVGWSKLPEAEQKTITEETASLAVDLHNVSLAKIAVGKRLLIIRQMLEPKRIFTKYLKTMFRMSKATAYRYIDLYQAAESVMSKPVLEVAMLRPDDRFTIKAIKEAPKAPRTTNVIKINEYLDKIQAKGPRLVSVSERKPDDVKKAMFHSIYLLLQKLPVKQRPALFVAVAGMVISELGLQKTLVEPVSVPDGFHAKRGRPRRTRKAA